jgi:hypothetical protein
MPADLLLLNFKLSSCDCLCSCCIMDMLCITDTLCVGCCHAVVQYVGRRQGPEHHGQLGLLVLTSFFNI